MNDDLKELLELLTSHHVEFVVIGAHALAVYCNARMTQDVDLWVRRDEQNVDRLEKALSEFGAAIGEQGKQLFLADQRRIVRLGAPPTMVDILNFADGPEFSQVWNSRVAGDLVGVKVFFPSLGDLISLKRAAGRPQDLADLEQLEAVE